MKINTTISADVHNYFLIIIILTFICIKQRDYKVAVLFYKEILENTTEARVVALLEIIIFTIFIFKLHGALNE